jgi:hypothetical protein
VLARVRKRAFLIERRPEYAVVSIASAPQGSIQLDPLANPATDGTPGEIAIAVTGFRSYQTMTLIRHAASTPASSVGN